MSLVLLEEGPVDGVRVLTLNDPDRRNAMSPQLQHELGEAVDAVAADPGARVLVVAARGPAFSAGADLPALFGRRDDVTALRGELRTIYDSFLRVRRLEIPTVAAINGAAVGAGVNLAMSCDVRIAGPRAKFGVTFSQLGIHPGGGCTWFLTRTLGRQRAFALIMDGGVLEAEEALALGLVLRVDEHPEVVAFQFAQRWSAMDPALARDVKRAVNTAERAGFEETLDFEGWAQAAAAARSPQLTEAIARFTR